jgi:hypothetical protein
MTTINEDIWANPGTWPAVTEVKQHIIDKAAWHVAHQLADTGSAFTVLEPDDGTRYELAIISAPQPDALFIDVDPEITWRFASSMGPLYPWRGNPTIHPDYAAEHYVGNHSMWTATVYALFLNSVSAVMHNQHSNQTEGAT